MRGLGSYNSSNTCCMSAPVVAAARFIQLAPPALAQADPRMNATCHYNIIQVHFDVICSYRHDDNSLSLHFDKLLFVPLLIR